MPGKLYTRSYLFSPVHRAAGLMIQQQTPLDAQVAQEESGGVADPFGLPPMSQGGMGPGPIPEQVFEGTGGVPPELINQLQNQMGVELPNM